MEIVSLIIPVFNRQEYIERCVSCAVCQDYPELEIIVVDDGSSDKSGEIIDKLAIRYPNVYVYHKCNGGVSSARNLGIEKSHGKWLAFLDSDDEIFPTYISDMIRNINGSAMVWTQCSINFYEDASEMDGVASYQYIINNRLLPSGPWCKLFNMDILTRYNIRFQENMHIGEDIDFIVRYLGVTNTSVTFVPRVRNYKLNDVDYSLCYRYYSFEDEYENYITLKKDMYHWQNSLKIEKKADDLWELVLSHCIERCLQCSIINKKGLKEFIDSVNLFSRKELLLFVKNHECLSAYDKILLKAIKYRLYFLYYCLIELRIKKRSLG